MSEGQANKIEENGEGAKNPTEECEICHLSAKRRPDEINEEENKCNAGNAQGEEEKDDCQDGADRPPVPDEGGAADGKKEDGIGSQNRPFFLYISDARYNQKSR